MKGRRGYCFVALAATLATVALNSGAVAALRVSPAEIQIDGPEASQQLLVTEVGPSGAELDVTRQVSLELS